MLTKMSVLLQVHAGTCKVMSIVKRGVYVTKSVVSIITRHRRNVTELAWQKYLEANKTEGAAISKAKRESFEEAIESARNEG